MSNLISLETLARRQALIEQLDKVIALGTELNQLLDQNTKYMEDFFFGEKKAA